MPQVPVASVDQSAAASPESSSGEEEDEEQAAAVSDQATAALQVTLEVHQTVTLLPAAVMKKRRIRP